MGIVKWDGNFKHKQKEKKLFAKLCARREGKYKNKHTREK
jgi:hypothetical protein